MNPLRVALILGVLCGVAAWQVGVIPESLMQMTVGPTLVPAVVVGGLSVLTLLYGLSAWRGQQADESLQDEQQPLPGANRRLVFLLGGGLAFMALVVPLGFVLPMPHCVAWAWHAPLTRRWASNRRCCAAPSPAPSGCCLPRCWASVWAQPCPG